MLAVKRTNYSAFNFREINANKSEDLYIDGLENDLSKIEIKDYKIENKTKDLVKPVFENFNFTSNNSFDVIQGKIYLNPMLFFANIKNPFVQEERVMPVYLGYPHRYVYGVTLDLPQGYVIESTPESTHFATDNKGASYEMNIIREEGKIKIEVVKEINKAIFATEDYNMLKNFYQQMIDKQNEKIVLKKI